MVRHEREGETDGYTWLIDGNWRWVEAGALTSAGTLWVHLRLCVLEFVLKSALAGKVACAF